MSDIKIDDNEIDILKKQYISLSIKYKEWIDSYIKLLNILNNEGVKSGIVHKNMILFTESAKSHLEQFTEISATILKYCDLFAKEIEVADGDIYQ